jgi:alkanesulfonate monooxygenase SsuD/methylene tetrahydromethanopterin reductase-like flavin-dependent oxidoreductase (luciferase family)
VSAPSVGCILNLLGTVEANQWRRLVLDAEGAGLDHVGVGDHVSFRTGVGNDALLTASTILAVSERLAANTAVYLLPLRHPVLVARQLADIGAAAPGRFVFGVGIGGEDRNEIAMCGVDPRTRGRRMEECVMAIRGLLSGEPIDFDGQFVRFTQSQIAPCPTQDIPILVGGRSEAAVRRAGRVGDGWFGIWVSPTRYGQAVEQMREVADGAGRDVPSWTNALNVWCAVDPSRDRARGDLAAAMEAFYGLPFSTFEKWSPAGTAEEVAEFLRPYAAAGCTLFNLIMTGPSAEANIEAAAGIRSLLVIGT